MRELALFLIGFATAAFGQDLALTLAPVKAVAIPAGPDSIRIEFDASLHLENVGPDSALLLMAEEPRVVGERISKARGFSPSEALVIQYLGPSVDTSEYWQALADRVLNAPLRESGLVVIPPQGSLGLVHRVVIIVPESKRPSYSSGRGDTPFTELLREDELWISLTLEIWPRNLDKAGGKKPVSQSVLEARSDDGVLATAALTSVPVRLSLRSEADVARTTNVP